MASRITEKHIAYILLAAVLLVLIVHVCCKLSASKSGNTVKDISQLPEVGVYLKDMNAKDIQYVEKNNLGVIQLLFTGHVSGANIEEFCRNTQWYKISAVHAKNALGNIYREFKVSEVDYPTSYTELDTVIDTPCIPNVKLLINVITKEERFTGKATINNRQR